MRAVLHLTLVVLTALPAFGQIYGARRYTQRIAPLTQPPPPAANPGPQPQQAAPVPQYYPQYAPQAVATPQVARPLSPADAAKAQAQKEKNEEKQFEYFKKRAEEGSDHAQYELGVRYLAGKGVAPDEKLGKEWLAKAAKNGNTPAAKKLAELGAEPEKSPEPSKAVASSEAAVKTADTKTVDTKTAATSKTAETK